MVIWTRGLNSTPHLRTPNTRASGVALCEKMTLLFILVLVLPPLFTAGINHFFLSNRLGSRSITTISTVFACIALIAGGALLEVKYEKDLAAFDLNHDGIFSGNEITPEQIKALGRVTNDSWRVFAPYTTFVFAIFYFCVLDIFSILIPDFIHRGE